MLLLTRWQKSENLQCRVQVIRAENNEKMASWSASSQKGGTGTKSKHGLLRLNQPTCGWAIFTQRTRMPNMRHGQQWVDLCHCLFQAFFGGFPPPKTFNFPFPQTAAKLFALNLFRLGQWIADISRKHFYNGQEMNTGNYLSLSDQKSATSYLKCTKVHLADPLEKLMRPHTT